MKTKPIIIVSGLLFLALALSPAYAEKIPALAVVPAGLPSDTQASLTQRRQELDAEYYRFQKAADAFNAKPAEQQSDREFQSVQQWRSQYIDKVNAFNRDITALNVTVPAAHSPQITASPIGIEARGDKPGDDANELALKTRAEIIDAMNALAKRLGWSAEKRTRLDQVLRKLDCEGATDVTVSQVRQTWQDVLNRGPDSDFAREAAKGGGPGFPGAGQQTVYSDCTIFSLANATGLPYGVVAARAADLIRQGEWRSGTDRANPQQTMEQKGLIGGEVVMLAEAFGQAEVVSGKDFAKTLKQGRPVLLNVVPSGGRGAHEVVLTKTFEHAGEPWYEMMESYHGPQRRLYLSAGELNIMQLENGVAFRPEAKRTPKLLREEGGQ